MVLLDYYMPDGCYECPCCRCDEVELYMRPRPKIVSVELEQRMAHRCEAAKEPVPPECAFRRPDWCPLIEVEEKRIQERVSHVDWQDRTVYVRKEETHDR